MDYNGLTPATASDGLSGAQSFSQPNTNFNFMDFLGSNSFGGAFGLGSLALNAYGLNKSLGFAEDQLGLMKQQEGRAATAQNLTTGNQLSLALQTTTPGTPEHERIKQAIAQNQFQV